MLNEIIEKARPGTEKAIERFREEIAKLRTGRANPAMVENLSVDYYGSKSPLKQVASITVPEPRLIVITPWSKDNLVDIEKALSESGLGLNPTNDGLVIRIAMPPLNEERRTELVKVLGKYSEEARVLVRQAREQAWDEIQDLVKSGKLGEDAKFKGKEQLQKLIDEYNEKIDEIRAKKEKEIMEV
ncbi:MAG: ribosome recycling factor, ribosome recycling factor [Candidatus Moranbacteria bacterium GW2011_GWC1_45_18]|nr:MAG: Ribosome-recycling factor [Candidatus Moranbacteria bacterium GW2011_GWC2_40_12]KKT33306.1 MAG: Ribosome-recycling factor [Candidatus Moranbacteria bacterium GW2011_GWF2_44_10]KKT99284.1 MAG: ribosome recycling factor, ribosome recycling factor [Candidatus Moranbacteria bacterium GW2011_GWC1_45_18]OGI40643.1 MAG: ribosome recycling factor [Candidatus Moranbacteria bacterium RIFOXYB1_FULL_44_23]OGI43163.1 MAG: ribosome recycling factor [Candidatus Moranbacteria bacterium RIFOXYD1_FULL_44